jgi:histidyl-tRNA synthetase
MLRGTRLLTGDDARLYTKVIATVRETVLGAGFEEVILPSLWEQETFVAKAGPEIVGQMWAFADKAGRQVCLHP